MERRLAIRKLSRLGNEFYLKAALAVMDLLPGHFERGVVALLLLKRCAPDWVEGSQLCRPGLVIRTSSIKALATSLGKPYATINRHIHKLIADGLCLETPAGYAISNTEANEPRIRTLLLTAHDSVVRLAEDTAVGLGLSEIGGPRTHELVVQTITAALDMWLVPYEYARHPIADWTSKLVWLAIIVANVRHITVDPLLSERWAYDTVPDEHRVPMTVRSIARITRLSYGTVFRHCQLLEAQDVIRYDRGGWLLETRQLLNEDVDQSMRDILRYYAKRLTDLTVAGFDTHNPSAFYLGLRPEHVPFSFG